MIDKVCLLWHSDILMTTKYREEKMVWAITPTLESITGLSWWTTCNIIIWVFKAHLEAEWLLLTLETHPYKFQHLNSNNWRSSCSPKIQQSTSKQSMPQPSLSAERAAPILPTFMVNFSLHFKIHRSLLSQRVIFTTFQDKTTASLEFNRFQISTTNTDLEQFSWGISTLVWTTTKTWLWLESARE
mgnify:CR=1 FL=1